VLATNIICPIHCGVACLLALFTVYKYLLDPHLTYLHKEFVWSFNWVPVWDTLCVAGAGGRWGSCRQLQWQVWRDAQLAASALSTASYGRSAYMHYSVPNC